MSEKRRLFREWQRTREENDQKRYKEANKECKRVVAIAKENAYSQLYEELKGKTKKDLQASQCQEKNGNGHWKSNSRERQVWHIAHRG